MPYVGIYAAFFVLPWALGIGNPYALGVGLIVCLVAVAGIG